ncbi:MAG: thymidine phosphorylase [Bacteriovoracales bacterium]|nr:thymidine phosphorylase [Bacteriovoracales bacterium]
MNAYSIIEKKRDAQTLSDEEVRWFVTELTQGHIKDYQASAFLMAAFINDLSPSETSALTKAMIESGRRLSFDEPNVVDKHSTGGIGDKTSFITGPIAAACGVKVPMVAGRGLGHTGGTVDKAESIPGFKTALTLENFRSLVEKNNIVLMGQTDDFAPVDKTLYALRDVTATINSIPLITASIMSKKLAEGIRGLVIDLKFGSGAFMKTVPDARRLALSMIELGRSYDLPIMAFLTNMNWPLGESVGNSLEVIECIETLKGQGPKDLEEISVELASGMIVLAGLADSRLQGKQMAQKALESGAALKKFEQLVKSQGGHPDIVSRPSLLSVARETHSIKAQEDGYIESFENDKIGRLLVDLGGGRKTKEEQIDPSVGFKFAKKPGDFVKAQETILTVFHHDSQKDLVESLEKRFFREIVEMSQSKPTLDPLILDVLGDRT